MLKSSGTASQDGPVLKEQKNLAGYHENIMSSLSKLVLASKIAAGLWPPPDSVHAMRFLSISHFILIFRYQAGQVLLAVRHFVAVAQDLALPLKPLTENDTTNDEFELKGAGLSDSELLSRLDSNCEVIVTGIASLVTKITRERTLSTSLIDHVRKTIVEIGQFMSIIEDIKYDTSMEHDNIIDDFVTKKDLLYSIVNELVTASSTGSDGFAPPNALGHMLETATSVLEIVEVVLTAAKVLIDHKELISQMSLYNESTSSTINDNRNSELHNLQRRTDELVFTASAGPVSAPLPSSSSNPTLFNRFSRDSRSSLTSPDVNSSQKIPNSPSFSRNRTPSGSGTELRVDSSRKLSGSKFRSSQDLGPMSGESVNSGKLSSFFGENAVHMPSNANEVFFQIFIVTNTV